MQGSVSLWNKIDGSIQDYNFTIQMLHGTHDWPTRILRDTPDYKRWAAQMKKQEGERAYVTAHHRLHHLVC